MDAKFQIKIWNETIDRKAAKERATTVLNLINRHHKEANSILELGVGIGEVLKHFPKRYELSGLDLSKESLKVSKKKIPRAKFIQANMCKFRINKKFDVIFSVHGCVNELGAFSNWEKTIKLVDKHLKNKGLFIFDTSTTKILKDFKKKKADYLKFSGGVIYTKPIIRGNILKWDYKILNKQRNKVLYEDDWDETIYSINKIKSALSKHFEILGIKLFNKGRDVLFVCRR